MKFAAPTETWLSLGLELIREKIGHDRTTEPKAVFFRCKMILVIWFYLMLFVVCSISLREIQSWFNEWASIPKPSATGSQPADKLRQCKITLWQFDITIDNGPFIVDLPIKVVIFHSYSSSKLRKFRTFTYIMNPSYSRPVSLDPLFSQPVSLCVTCFTPVNWLVAVGRPFSSIWKLFGTMSMPCVVPEMLWSLDELKRALK